jgi:hypothetical protein
MEKKATTFTVQGREILVPGAVVGGKNGPSASSSYNRGRPEVSRQAPEAFMRLAKETRELGGLRGGRRNPAS